MNLIWTSYHLIRMMFSSLIYLNNKSYMDWIQVTHGVTLNNITQLNIFELDANFDNFTVRLYYFCIFSIFAKFQDDQKLIVISSINYLNSNFYSLKYCIKNKFMDKMVNNNQLT